MSTSLRPLGLARGAWGLLLLAAPQAVTARTGGDPADPRERAVFRVLGARHLLQAVVSGLAPGPAVLAVGAWVDAAHSLTGLALALVDRSRARLALTDAAVAAAWALASRRDARRAGRPGAAGRVPASWAERAARRVLPLLPGAPR